MRFDKKFVNYLFNYLLNLFFFCWSTECKPKSECDPIMTYSDLKPGEIVVNDTTGCCPKSELLCDKSMCPEKPTKCVEEFYEVVKAEPLPDQCCNEYKCGNF